MRKQKSFFAKAKSDWVAGIIVFLIALPLCLGIAQASNAPLFSGIVAGVVGGIVIGFFSRSQLSVSGPAAGLVAIVIGAIAALSPSLAGGEADTLAGFRFFLCSVMIAGLIQLLLGFLKAGAIANYFPSSVIEGMLAGIGLTIILKQLPEALGMSDASGASGWTLGILNAIEPGAVVIALLGLGIFILWSGKRMKKAQIVPAALLVVVVGTLLNQLFRYQAPQWYVDGGHLVQLPVPRSLGDFTGQFLLPDFSGFADPEVWQFGIIIAVVASIETLLCIEATDKLDPLKRYTPGNAELKAQGIGNMLSGLIGGLPITSVIVRSSANINAGATSRLSTITHGVLLLVCAATIPMVLNLIPKAALAAVLIYTGYRLCRPAVFKHMWHAGTSQFIPFVVTTVAVALPMVGLLKGVGIGMVISIFYILRNNLRMPFFYRRSVYQSGEVISLDLAQDVSFLNKASIKRTLERLPRNSTVIIDATQAEFIDYDVLELIRDFQQNQAPHKEIDMSLLGFKNMYNLPGGLLSDLETLENIVRRKGAPIKRTAGRYKKLLRQLSV